MYAIINGERYVKRYVKNRYDTNSAKHTINTLLTNLLDRKISITQSLLGVCYAFIINVCTHVYVYGMKKFAARGF